MSKIVVISAVNITDGGPLTVLRECLDAAVQCLYTDWKIIALVHNKELLKGLKTNRIKVIEFPNAKKSWLRRLWLEWVYFDFISRGLKPNIWLSLHDITPRVQAKYQAVYCHCPAPFHKVTWPEAYFDPKFAMFCFFYDWIYRAFIFRNSTVVVQQEWLRQAFQKRYQHPNILVAYPTRKNSSSTSLSSLPLGEFSRDRKLIMLYPVLPRVHKNFEVICDAVRELPLSVTDCVELRLTVSGTENRYANYIYKCYSRQSNIKFIGHQSKQDMEKEYQHCNLVVFPSRLESWGLPISEAKALGKPLLVADLPYAYETVGNYSAVTFLPANDYLAWSNVIEKIIKGVHTFDQHIYSLPDEPFASDWFAFWNFLVQDALC